MRSSVVVLKRGEPRHILFAALAVPCSGHHLLACQAGLSQLVGPGRPRTSPNATAGISAGLAPGVHGRSAGTPREMLRGDRLQRSSSTRLGSCEIGRGPPQGRKRRSDAVGAGRVASPDIHRHSGRDAPCRCARACSRSDCRRDGGGLCGMIGDFPPQRQSKMLCAMWRTRNHEPAALKCVRSTWTMSFAASPNRTRQPFSLQSVSWAEM
jgi:hypothetical protein